VLFCRRARQLEEEKVASMEMTELLLGDQERKQMGWMISETELTRNDRIAQGAFGAVYQDRILGR